MTLFLPSGKMIARQDGAIGHVIFNNPERRKAVSLEMWDALDVGRGKTILLERERECGFAAAPNSSEGTLGCRLPICHYQNCKTRRSGRRMRPIAPSKWKKR